MIPLRDAWGHSIYIRTGCIVACSGRNESEPGIPVAYRDVTISGGRYFTVEDTPDNMNAILNDLRDVKV